MLIGIFYIKVFTKGKEYGIQALSRVGMIRDLVNFRAPKLSASLAKLIKESIVSELKPTRLTGTAVVWVFGTWTSWQAFLKTSPVLPRESEDVP